MNLFDDFCETENYQQRLNVLVIPGRWVHGSSYLRNSAMESQQVPVRPASSVEKKFKKHHVLSFWWWTCQSIHPVHSSLFSGNIRQVQSNQNRIDLVMQSIMKGMNCPVHGPAITRQPGEDWKVRSERKLQPQATHGSHAATKLSWWKKTIDYAIKISRIQMVSWPKNIAKDNSIR